MAAAKNSGRSERSPNYSPEEKNILIDLFLKHKDVILDKKIDSVSSQKKVATWQQIEKEFAAVFGVVVGRGWRNLKCCYSTLKKSTFKATNCDKKDVIKVMDEHRQYLVGNLSNWSKPAHVVVVVDGNELLVESENNGRIKAATENGVDLGDAELADLEDSAVIVQDVDLVSNCTAMSYGDETYQSLSKHFSSENDSSDDDLPLGSHGAAQPIRLLPIRQLQATGGATVDSCSQSGWLMAKQRYYEEKLKMAEKEHDARMKLLLAQEELFRKKLKSLEKE